MSTPFRQRNPVPIGAISIAVILGLLVVAFRANDLPLIGGGDTYHAAFAESGRLKVNDEVRTAEESEWARSNPEARARAEATVGQLRTSIANLEADAEKARAAGDEKKAGDADEAAATRRTWLVEAEKTLTEFS